MPDDSIVINVSNFNPKDQVQFTPSFSYDGIVKFTPTITITIPSFPSLLQANDLTAKKDPIKKIDSVLDSTNTFGLVGFNHTQINTNTSRFILYLEGRWFYPRTYDNKNPITTWDKQGLTNEQSAKTLEKGSIIQFIASAGGPLAPLNGRIFNLNWNTINMPPEYNPINPSASTTSSVRLVFTTTPISSPAASTDSKIHSLNRSINAIRDYTYYEKYDLWNLSLNNNSYLTTLNSTKYIKDVVIFSYSINGNKSIRYLVKEKNNDINTQIDVTSSLPTYSQISSLYISSIDLIPKLSIQTGIYDILKSQSVSFSARVIRYIDPTGQGNFTNAVAIDGHNWVDVKIVN